VRALSFMGTGISSSELSLRVEYCCDCDFASFPPAPTIAGAEPPTGFDSLRLICCLEVGRRRACLADVLRPIDVKWLPGPSGVGDAADIAMFGRFNAAMSSSLCCVDFRMRRRECRSVLFFFSPSPRNPTH